MNSKCQQTLFAAEDYSGKKEVIEEVMQHWVKDRYSNVA